MSKQLDAKTAHAHLRQALALLRETECNAVTLFAEIMRRCLFRELGFATIHIYASEALGFSRTKTYEFIRLSEALEKLPSLKASLASGELPWTKAREVVKVATPETEKRWIEIAGKKNRRELEAQVLRSRANRNKPKRNPAQCELLTEAPAATPLGNYARLSDPTPLSDPAPPPAAPSQSLTLRLSPMRRARFDALVEKLMRRFHCDREEILLIAMEALLGGGMQPSSGEEFTHGEGSAHAESPTHAESPAQIDRPAHSTRSSQSGKPAQGGLSPRGDAGTPYQIVIYRCERCAESAVGPERKALGTAETAQVECDCKFLEPGKRNRRSIPPSRRRAVLLRDGYRCRTQGCGSASFLEVHHLLARGKGGGKGGGNEDGNLITLCSSCHLHLHERGGKGAPLRAL